MLSGKERRRFQRLVKRYLAGKATPAEKDFIESYYRYPGFENREVPPVGEAMEEMFFQRLETRLDMPAPAPVIPIYRRPAMQAAAAVAILLLSATWLYFAVHSKQPAPASIVKQDVPPGGNKATLTLGDGRVLVLDSAANGVLARQGLATVQKTEGGQLAYVPVAAKNEKVFYNTLSTPVGGQYKLTLPDGTKVWLNSASSISYPTAFTGHERRVTITGEAYLEVSKDASKPFFANARGVSIKVLGTSFDIMAYEDEPAVTATLVSGKVRVEDGGSSALLQPGQQAVKEGAVMHVQEADVEKETAWVHGFFEFDQTNLVSLMRQLRRWYGIEAVYQGGDTTRLFGGRINRNMTLSQVLDLLQGNGIHFTIEGKKLIVLP